MLKKLLEAGALAVRDWRHERSLSLCSLLALASMLAPLLVLQGVKNGVVESMRANLLRDPVVLIITPKADGGDFSPEFVEGLRHLPGARFAIGRTRDTAADMTLRKAGGTGTVSVAMEPSAPGEPVLERHALPAPRDGQEPEIVLSEPAARALGVGVGGVVTARLGRRTPEGRLESAELRFHVVGVLPGAAADRRMGFLPLQVLEDIEDYRDVLEVPSRGFAGRPRQGSRAYASFRLYAESLEHVEPLAKALEEAHIEVSTRAREIAGIRVLEAAIRQVILIISLAVGAGFAAFTMSSVQGAIERKRRMLGMLRLLGFPRPALMLYPVTQTLLTAGMGTGLAFVLYAVVGLGIDRAFAGQGGVLSCHLTPGDMVCAGGIVALLSFLAAARASFRAGSIEPSAVLREV